jgi:hypothetical protein
VRVQESGTGRGHHIQGRDQKPQAAVVSRAHGYLSAFVAATNVPEKLFRALPFSRTTPLCPPAGRLRRTVRPLRASCIIPRCCARSFDAPVFVEASGRGAPPPRRGAGGAAGPPPPRPYKYSVSALRAVAQNPSGNPIRKSSRHA